MCNTIYTLHLHQCYGYFHLGVWWSCSSWMSMERLFVMCAHEEESGVMDTTNEEGGMQPFRSRIRQPSLHSWCSLHETNAAEVKEEEERSWIVLHAPFSRGTAAITIEGESLELLISFRHICDSAAVWVTSNCLRTVSVWSPHALASPSFVARLTPSACSLPSRMDQYESNVCFLWYHLKTLYEILLQLWSVSLLRSERIVTICSSPHLVWSVYGCVHKYAYIHLSPSSYPHPQFISFFLLLHFPPLLFLLVSMPWGRIEWCLYMEYMQKRWICNHEWRDGGGRCEWTCFDP